MDGSGQAFPWKGVALDGTPMSGAGMSLRDWYAGQALVGYVARGYTVNVQSIRKIWKIADAMIAERAKS